MLLNPCSLLAASCELESLPAAIMHFFCHQDAHLHDKAAKIWHQLDEAGGWTRRTNGLVALPRSKYRALWLEYGIRIGPDSGGSLTGGKLHPMRR
jgi:hypothetical protein